MDEATSDIGRARALVSLHEALGEAEADLQGLLQHAAQEASLLLGDAAAIWVLDGHGIELRGFAHRSRAVDVRGSLPEVRHDPDGLLASAISRGESLHVVGEELAALLPRIEAAYHPHVARHGVADLLLVPLRTRGQHLGAIGVSRDRGSRLFGDNDEGFLAQIARVVSLTVANAVLLDEVGDAQRRARLLSREDDLTGLLNRRGFLHTLRSRLDDPDLRSALVAVLDMDGFRLVNDGFGHAAGDAVLVSMASRLCAALPTRTPVARIGADEFAVLVEAPDDETAAAIVDEAVVHCTGTISVVGLSVPMTLSVGTAVPEAGAADEALQHADLAMYRAKRRGLTRAAYDAQLDDPATRRLREVLDLRKVITGGELVVHYQTVVPVRTGPLRVEALVRRQLDGRLQAPDGWLEVAGNAGLMADLTESVVGKVVDQLAAWWATGLQVEVAVNVPAPVLAAPEVLNTLLERLDAAGLPRRALSVEVTEGDLVGPQAKAALTRCADADIGVAVDDFGTGWSALSYLVDLPLRTLKIDRAVVDGCDLDRRRASVVKAVVDVAHELGLRVVAEGVETTSVADAVIDLGADAIQGYLYGRPAGPQETEQRLRSGQLATRS